MTIDVGLTESPLAVPKLAAPEAQVTTGGAIVQAFLQSGFHQSVSASVNARKVHIVSHEQTPN
jgi:hypothetical protein